MSDFRWRIGLALWLALAAGALASQLAPAPARAAERKATAAAPALPTARVRLVPATGMATAGARWVAASLAAARRATLSTRLSATVRSVLVDEGAKVRAGQVLVRLADADVQAQLAAAEAGLATATAHERRMRALAAERAATPVELELAGAERAHAAAAVASARESLAYAALRAPFDGTVQSRLVNAGDLVGPGQPLLELEGARLELQATLSDAEVGGLSVGDRLRFEAAGGRGEARVTALTPGGDPLSHRRFLRAAVLEPAVDGAKGGGPRPRLRSGTFARVELPERKPAAGVNEGSREAWVPRSAVVERGDLTGVFVVEEGRA